MLTRLSPDAADSADRIEQLEEVAVERIRKECPKVRWIQNLAVLGPYDYLDIFSAPDNDTAMKVATIIRTSGHAHVEIWAAEQWLRFKTMLENLDDAEA
jgi:uncharacterized protein with GYD domain